MDPADIRQCVDDIRASVLVGESEERIARAHPEFKQKYPLLFSCAVEPRFDMQNLEYMLQQLATMRDQTKASEQVGTMLFDKYVQPRLSSASLKKNP